MIERVGEIAGVAMAMPSSGLAIERRRRRLKWLSSLRTALAEAGPLVEELGSGVAAVQTRARIADALSLVEEMRGRLGAGAGEEESDAAVSGGTITATDLARRIAASADRSLATQARLGPAAVRRIVDGSAVNGV